MILAPHSSRPSSTMVSSVKNLMESTVTVHQEAVKTINSFLYGKTPQPRDGICFVTALFCDGVEMDIKCCQSGSSSYSEAVLYAHGCEVGRTDQEDYFLGLWQIEYDGMLYAAIVEEAKKE